MSLNIQQCNSNSILFVVLTTYVCVRTFVLYVFFVCFVFLVVLWLWRKIPANSLQYEQHTIKQNEARNEM